jgi:hypothetical protein
MGRFVLVLPALPRSARRRAAMVKGSGAALDARRPLRGRRGACRAAPAVRPLLAQSAVRPGPCIDKGAILEAASPGPRSAHPAAFRCAACRNWPMSASMSAGLLRRPTDTARLQSLRLPSSRKSTTKRVPASHRTVGNKSAARLKGAAMLSESSPLKKKTALFAAVTAVAALFFLEAFASFAVLLRMRLKHEPFTRDEPTYFSVINVPYKMGVKLGLFDPLQPLEYRISSEPSPSGIADAELGYKPVPGRYQLTFSRRVRGSSEWERLRVNETRTPDGARWTGDCPNSNATVYIFGDSFTAGTGVNDEQTFSFLLQQARKDLCVKLFAVGGYGMTQSFILFNKVRNQINPNDIIILGYADFFDLRTVMAPSRLREARDWNKPRLVPLDSIMLPKAAFDAQGAIRISYVQQRCDENSGYCDHNDPTKDEMMRITAALINQIAQNSEATVYLLHFEGMNNNPIFGLLDDRVHRISALGEDFDYFVRDDIAGFDPHPGPYWHYAISRKLLEALGPQN